MLTRHSTKIDQNNPAFEKFSVSILKTRTLAVSVDLRTILLIFPWNSDPALIVVTKNIRRQPHRRVAGSERFKLSVGFHLPIFQVIMIGAICYWHYSVEE